MLYFIVIVSRGGDRQFIEFIDYLNIVYVIYTFTSYYRKHTKAFLLFPVFCYL